MKNHGIFTISLDFELYWGIRDKKSPEQYEDNINGAWIVVPKLLELFKKNEISATWAVVGAMLCKNSGNFHSLKPEILPEYVDKILSPYLEFEKQLSTINEKFVFGNELFQLLKVDKKQEIGTHSFSHYYCLEEGQTEESFVSDLKAGINVLKMNDVSPKSYIFPRHQINQNYLAQFCNHGIETYRGTEKIWYNAPSKGDEEGLIKRAIRFADYYLKMGSNHCQDLSNVKQKELYEIKASRWLRPYSHKWRKLDFLKMSRIKSQMKYAAKNGKIFQLWFHPHDIGSDIVENFQYLEEIIRYFKILEQKYQFKSCNFNDIKNLYDETY